MNITTLALVVCLYSRKEPVAKKSSVFHGLHLRASQLVVDIVRVIVEDVVLLVQFDGRGRFRRELVALLLNGKKRRRVRNDHDALRRLLRPFRRADQRQHAGNGRRPTEDEILRFGPHGLVSLARRLHRNRLFRGVFTIEILHFSASFVRHENEPDDEENVYEKVAENCGDAKVAIDLHVGVRVGNLFENGDFRVQEDDRGDDRVPDAEQHEDDDRDDRVLVQSGKVRDRWLDSRVGRQGRVGSACLPTSD